MSLLDWLHGTALTAESGAIRANGANPAAAESPTRSERVEPIAPIAPIARSCGRGAELTAQEENALRQWLDRIEETHPDLIAETLDRCRADEGVKRFFLELAETAGAAD